MKRRLVDILVCPIDRGRLELISFNSQRRTLDDASRARSLDWRSLPSRWKKTSSMAAAQPAHRHRLPDHQRVPRMLVFRSGASQRFLSASPTG